MEENLIKRENYKLNLEFEVKRVRSSVTQGEAKVLCNGEHIITFRDNLEMIKPYGNYYGARIGGWASTVPDAEFIKAAVYHPLSAKFREILESEKEKQVQASNAKRTAVPMKIKRIYQLRREDGVFLNGQTMLFDSDDDAADFAAKYEAMCVRIDRSGNRTLVYDPRVGKIGTDRSAPVEHPKNHTVLACYENDQQYYN